MGCMLKSPILRIDSLFFIALNHHISITAAENNEKYLNMVRECVSQKALYFAKQFNFTFNTSVYLANLSKDRMPAGDDRYYFNIMHVQQFIDWGITDILTPVIYGFFAVFFKRNY